MEIALGRWIDLALLFGIGIPASIIDIRERKIPIVIVMAGAAVFLATKIFLNNDFSFWQVLDAAVGFTSIAGLGFLTRGGIGLGDAELCGLFAFILGIYFWVAALFVASTVGLIVCGTLLVLKKIERKEGIPFAPFLAIGSIVSYILKYFILKDVTGLWQSVSSIPK